MTHSPTPTELLALKTAHAAEASKDASYDLVSTIVFALGSAQLLQSPETAAELSRLRDRVAELETAQSSFLLPWAHQLDAKSLDNFVGDLIRAAETTPLMLVASEIEETVRHWRELVASPPAEAPTVPARPVEDPHDSPLHHDYKFGRDLPEAPRV